MVAFRQGIKVLLKFMIRNFFKKISSVMSSTGSRDRFPPVVVILGATGTGKSKLALQIASRINGEIVSADSMQVYKGLDIITNKVTPEEMKVCPHHMIGIYDPLHEFTSLQFQQEVLRIIDDIHSRGKVPVIAGGTYYYLEGILWNQLLNTKQTSDDDREKFDDRTNESLHQQLQEIDPDTALLLHPNDRRKIIRALEVGHLHQ